MPVSVSAATESHASIDPNAEVLGEPTEALSEEELNKLKLTNFAGYLRYKASESGAKIEGPPRVGDAEREKLLREEVGPRVLKRLEGSVPE